MYNNMLHFVCNMPCCFSDFFFFFTVFKEFGLSISRIVHLLVEDTTNKSKDFSVVCS